MTGWHLYPRYFVLPDRSWRGVAFIDDPLDQNGVYIGQSDGQAPDWRDHDEQDRDLYTDGVYRRPENDIDETAASLFMPSTGSDHLLPPQKASKSLKIDQPKPLPGFETLTRTECQDWETFTGIAAPKSIRRIR